MRHQNVETTTTDRIHLSVVTSNSDPALPPQTEVSFTSFIGRSASCLLRGRAIEKGKREEKAAFPPPFCFPFGVLARSRAFASLFIVRLPLSPKMSSSTQPPAPPSGASGELDKAALARTLSHRPSLPRHMSIMSEQVTQILANRDAEAEAAAAGSGGAPSLLSLVEAAFLLVLGGSVALYAPSSLFWRLVALWIFVECAAYVAFKSR